jgi:predicted esterase
MAATEQTIAVTTHGRYLVDASAPAAPMLAGFHGYAEAASLHLERLSAIPGAGRWTIVSIQGLHRFYQRRSGEVVASWMTREDRDLAIADNRAYVAAAIEAEWRRHACARGVVVAGFSQGVAMAFRAPSSIRQPILGVIAVGGDVPPEIAPADLARLGRVLLMRGVKDPVYSTETFTADRARLEAAGVDVTAIEFEGGHEWSAPVHEAAARFLDERWG